MTYTLIVIVMATTQSAQREHIHWPQTTIVRGYTERGCHIVKNAVEKMDTLRKLVASCVREA